MKKVKIILPKAQMGRSTQALNPGQFNVRPLTKGAPALTPTKILKPVDRENANLEAEKGETVFGDINQDTMPEFYTVGGDRHYNGGTPLNLPDNTFIYSRDNKMKIKNPELLKEFGKSSKKGKGYTPADLSKTYDLTDFRKTLQNPDSDKLERETAERMIANYNMKLGKLALAQESLKGFPEGIPQVAIPYLTTHGINPANLVGDEQNPMMGQAQPSDDMQVTPQPQAKYGRETSNGSKVRVTLPKAQEGTQVNTPSPIDKSKIAGDALSKSFQSLQNVLTKPENSKLRDDIYINYKKHIQDSKLSAPRKQALLKVPEAEVIANFMKGQEQVYAIKAAGINTASDTKGTWDHGIKNAKYKETMKKLGYKDTDVLSDDQVAMFQAAYKGAADVSTDPQYKDSLAGFSFRPTGMRDQQYNGWAVSPVDDWFGNTTAGQAAIAKEAEPLVNTPTTKKEDALAAIPGTIEDDIRKVPPSEWWLQDIIKTAGAVSDKARLQKYMPWAPPVQPYIEEPTFYDPTRELAANAEMIGIGTMGLTNFSDPQAYNARFSQIQGQGAENAANILGKYNNLNVTESNRANGRNAAELNKASLLNKGIAQDLYDKTIITNQQFDNSKNIARQEVRKSYIDAVTNRAQTQALNSLYPQFNVSPITGGLTHFTKGKKIKPITPQDQQAQQAAYINAMVKAVPGSTPGDWINPKTSSYDQNKSYQDPNIPDAEQLKQLYARFYGTE